MRQQSAFEQYEEERFELDRSGTCMNLWKQKSDDNFPQIWSLAEMYISVGAKSELAGEAEPNQFSTNSAWTSQYFTFFNLAFYRLLYNLILPLSFIEKVSTTVVAGGAR